jgi:hypothetical protein
MRLVKIKKSDTSPKFQLTDSDFLAMSPAARYFHCKFIEANVLQSFNEINKSQKSGSTSTEFVDELMLGAWNEIYVRNGCAGF